MRSQKTKHLDVLLVSTINETIVDIFGKPDGVTFFLNILKNACNLRPEDAPERLEEFSSSLRAVLGSGAIPVERQILKNMYSKLGLRFQERKTYSFSDYIRELESVEVVPK